MAFALRSESDYWASLAVRWLADGFPIDETVVCAGDEVVAAKRGTQNRAPCFDTSDDMNRAPNPIALGNGAMAFLFQIQHLWRAAPEQYRWAR